jgi:hypothetical protein
MSGRPCALAVSRWRLCARRSGWRLFRPQPSVLGPPSNGTRSPRGSCRGSLLDLPRHRAAIWAWHGARIKNPSVGDGWTGPASPRESSRGHGLAGQRTTTRFVCLRRSRRRSSRIVRPLPCRPQCSVLTSRGSTARPRSSRTASASSCALCQKRPTPTCARRRRPRTRGLSGLDTAELMSATSFGRPAVRLSRARSSPPRNASSGRPGLRVREGASSGSTDRARGVAGALLRPGAKLLDLLLHRRGERNRLENLALEVEHRHPALLVEGFGNA